MTTVQGKELQLQMQYLGAVQVLCTTHNKLVQALEQDVDSYGTPLSTEAIENQVAIMERVVSDFNRLVHRKEVIQDGNTFNIFDKDDDG